MNRPRTQVASGQTPRIGGAPAIPKTMRAIVYRGVNDLRLEELPVPKIQPGELLVKVAVCGVCPTDIKKIQYGTVPPPRVFGHETAGTIVQVGAGARGFKAGDRVALHHHIPCLKADCHACRHRAFAQCAGYKRTGITAGFEPAGGGYAEYVRVMPFVLPGVVKIPSKNTFEEGAMLEPVNTVLKAVKRLPLLKSDSALVLGQGPIGLLFTRLLVLAGMRVAATDLKNPKLLISSKLGASIAVNPADGSSSTKLDRFAQNHGFDAAVVTVPSDAVVDEALARVRPAGTVLLFAHTRRGQRSGVDFGSVCVDEKDLIGSYSADVTLQPEVSRLVFSRKLDVRQLITHKFSLPNTADAVTLAANPTEESLKVMVCAGEFCDV